MTIMMASTDSRLQKRRDETVCISGTRRRIRENTLRRRRGSNVVGDRRRRHCVVRRPVQTQVRSALIGVCWQFAVIRFV